MSINIYWISGSAPAWRVLLVLETKGIEYNSHVLQTSKKEQKQDWFLELNPRGQIPLLKDDDVIVSESLAIMHYLEKKHPEPSLFGQTPEMTGVIEKLVHEILSYVDKPIADIVQPIFRNKVEEHKASMIKATEVAHQELKTLENKLNQSDWLASTEFSAADIVFIPTLQRLLRAIQKAPKLAKELGLASFANDYPQLSAWNNRIQALSAFENTFPPHWRN